MELALTQRQMSYLIKHSVNQRLSMYEQDTSGDASAAQPSAGTSSQQSGGQGYPEVGKWESGVERGAGNQVGVTKWSDVVGSKLVRGKGNPLKEQMAAALTPSTLSRNSGFTVPTTSVNSGISGQSTVKQKNDNKVVVDFSTDSISKTILDVRHFFFETYLGMATEIAFVIATEGFGEIAVQGMNVIILVNDIHIFMKNGGFNQVPKGLSFMEQVEYLYNVNNDFANVCISTAVVMTGGVFSIMRRLGKTGGFAKFKSLVGKGGGTAFVNFLKTIFSKISTIISKLAKPIYEKISKIIPGLKTFVDYIQGLLAGNSGKLAQKAVTIPLVIGKTYIGLLAIEAGIGTLKLLGRGFKWTANEISLAINGKSTPEMVQKVDAVMVPADKQKLQESQGKVVKDAYAAVIKGGETTRKTTYEVMIDMKLIDCSYNEFNIIPDAKHDMIYVIKNVKYYVTPDLKLIKIK